MTRALLLALLLPLGACALQRRAASAPVMVVTTPAVAADLGMTHARLSGHSKLPDHEWVRCLRGEIQGRRIIVDDAGVTQIVRLTSHGVSYVQCDGPRYIGTWHSHPTGLVPPNAPRADGCYFSIPDSIAFLRDKRAAVQLVSCGDPPRLHARSRRGIVPLEF